MGVRLRFVQAALSAYGRYLSNVIGQDVAK